MMDGNGPSGTCIARAWMIWKVDAADTKAHPNTLTTAFFIHPDEESMIHISSLKYLHGCTCITAVVISPSDWNRSKEKWPGLSRSSFIMQHVVLAKKRSHEEEKKESTHAPVAIFE